MIATYPLAQLDGHDGPTRVKRIAGAIDHPAETDETIKRASTSENRYRYLFGRGVEVEVRYVDHHGEIEIRGREERVMQAKSKLLNMKGLAGRLTLD